MKEIKMKRYNVLVLNSDYRPLSIFPIQFISGQRALRSVYNGLSHVVTEYDQLVGTTPAHTIYWPAVIARNNYLKRERIAVLNRETLYYRDNCRCAYTGEKILLREATIDHVIPRSKGGKHVWENVVIASPAANFAKGDKLPEGEWKPKRMPYKPTYGQLLKMRRKYAVNVYHESWVTFLGQWDGDVRILKPYMVQEI